jgi:hypothetical protein
MYHVVLLHYLDPRLRVCIVKVGVRKAPVYMLIINWTRGEHRSRETQMSQRIASIEHRPRLVEGRVTVGWETFP